MKNQENLNLNKKIQSMDIISKITEMLKLSEKDFEAVTKKMLQEKFTDTLETNQKIKSQQKYRGYKGESNRNFREKIQ